MRELNEHREQAMKFARQRAAYVDTADTPGEADAYFKQRNMAVTTLFRALTAIEKLTKFLSEEE